MAVAAMPPTSPNGHSTGTLLGGRYSLTRRIAVGGMGEVWAATDTVLHRPVAVKILRDELVDSPTFLERFRAEARHTASLAHPGIASVFDYGEDIQSDRCIAYLVMELVAGTPLSKVLADRGVLPVGTALSFLAQTARAVHAAHIAGVVHRDIKPGNLLVLDDGTIKVTDFGIARAVNSVPLTTAGQVVGTARYMSPEQASGGEATPASDVYSLGVIGYEMLTGQPPFTAESPAALAIAHIHRPPPPLPLTIPAGLRAVIGQALSKNPAERPGDAEAFAGTLHQLQMTTTPPPGNPTKTSTERSAATLNAGIEAPTRVMGFGDESHTEIMPGHSPAARGPDLGLSRQAYESRRQRRWLAIAVLAAIVLALVLIQLRASGGSDLLDAATPTTSTVTSATIDPHALIGLPVRRASELLSKEGLVVAIRSVDAAGVAAGLVTGVEPTGEVSPGTIVTLDVSSGTVTTTTATIGNGKGHDKDKGKPKD